MVEKKERASFKPADAEEQAPSDNRPLFAKVSDQFNNMEILSLMKGDLSKVPNFAKRCQEFMTNWMGKRSFNQVNKDIMQSLGETLLLPDELKEVQIYGELDPVSFLMQLLEADLHDEMMNVITVIPKFQGSDEEFGEMMKNNVTIFVTAVLRELNDGFEDDFAKVQAFMKANISNMLEKASEPKNAKLTSMLGTPNIMNFVNQCWNQRSKDDLVEKPVKKEEQKETPTQAVAETLAQRYARQLANDKSLMARNPPQPASNAFCALELETSRALTRNEKKLIDQKLTLEKPREVLPPHEHMHKQLTQAMLESGKF